MEVKFEITDMKHADEIIALCGEWWEDSLFFKKFRMPYKPEKSIFQSIEDAGMLFIVVGKLDDEIVSCFVASIGPYHFNIDYLVCSEIVWCVKPELQKHGVSVHLINFVEKKLKSIGVNLLGLNVSAAKVFNNVGPYLENFHDFILMDGAYFKEL